LTREVLLLKNTPGLIRGQPWDVMVDLFLYRAPEEQDKEETTAALEEPGFQRPGYEQEGAAPEYSQGQTWEGQDWNYGPIAEARYANYFSGDFGYVVGGTWPEESSTVYSSFDRTRPRKLTKNLMFDGHSLRAVPHKPSPRDGFGDGYIGLIASTASGSSQWTLLQNFTNDGLYFNQISCSDQNNCWAVCEGNNVTTGAVSAWIYATNDGWSTYSIQKTFEGGSLVAIQMLNSTFGWAAGGLLPAESTANGRAGITAYVFQTTDGKTWNTLSTLNGLYIFDVSLIDENNGFAIGINEGGLANLARYAPSSA